MSKAKATVKYKLCQLWNPTDISTNQVWARLPPQSHHRILSLLDTGNLWQGEGCRNQVKLHLKGQNTKHSLVLWGAACLLCEAHMIQIIIFKLGFGYFRMANSAHTNKPLLCAFFLMKKIDTHTLFEKTLVKIQLANHIYLYYQQKWIIYFLTLVTKKTNPSQTPLKISSLKSVIKLKKARMHVGGNHRIFFYLWIKTNNE